MHDSGIERAQEDSKVTYVTYKHKSSGKSISASPRAGRNCFEELHRDWDMIRNITKSITGPSRQQEQDQTSLCPTYFKNVPSYKFCDRAWVTISIATIEYFFSSFLKLLWQMLSSKQRLDTLNVGGKPDDYFQLFERSHLSRFGTSTKAYGANGLELL